MALLAATLASLAGCSEAPSSRPYSGVAQQPLDEVHLVASGALAGSPSSAGDRFGFAVGVAESWIVSAQVDPATDQIRVFRSGVEGAAWAAPEELIPTGVSASRWLEPFVDATVSPSGAAQAVVGTGQVDGSVVSFDLATGQQLARLSSPSLHALRFGSALKANGSWLAVGDYLDGEAGVQPGAVHLFEREADGWAFRQSIAGSATLGSFGQAVALSGSYLAVGAPRADSGASNLGAVHVYHLEQSAWVAQQTLLPDTILADTRFGRAVALTDDQLVVSAPGDSSFASEAGAVYLFQRSGASWTLKDTLGPAEDYAGFGVAVALGNGLLAIGAHGDVNDPRSDPRGYVQTYYQADAAWEPLARLPTDTQHNASATARYGHALATDGKLLAVGVPDVSVASGRVYTYTLEETLETAASCANDAQCKSGHCVDGVCCDAACDGVCEACTNAKRGAGADGVCGPVVKGLDPDQECPNNPGSGSACEEISACTGEARCDCVVSGTLQCTSDTVRIDERGKTVSCVPYRCSANTCLSTCSSSADCSPGASCSSERRCVIARASAGDDSGCALSSVRPRGSGSRTIVWLFGWLVLLARRRTAREPKQMTLAKAPDSA